VLCKVLTLMKIPSGGWYSGEYLARFKRDATTARKQAHARYKKWTADTKQKQIAGFTASLRSAAGDDSLDQSQND
jgi:hypothetical protein